MTRYATGILDTGKRRVGVALFDTSTRVLLATCELTNPSPMAPQGTGALVASWGLVTALEMGYAVEGWVVEDPQNYRHGDVKEDDLDDLRYVIEELETAVTRVTRVRPAKWKGQVPKPIHQRRILASLTPDEHALVLALPRCRDAVDAVGLGLVYFGRASRGRTGA